MNWEAKPDIYYDIGDSASAGPTLEDQMRNELQREIVENNLSSAEIMPEYERSLERVLLTIPSYANVEEYYGDFIVNCPDYTHFEVVVDEDRYEEIKKLFRRLKVDEDRISFCKIEDGYRVEEWAQDYTDVFTVNGESRLMVMMEMAPPPEGWEEIWDKFVERGNQRTQLLTRCLASDQYLQVPFIFQGGNILFDTTDEGSKVFIGYDDIMVTDYAYRWNGVNFSREEIVGLISSYLGGAEVIVVGKRKQPEEIFHLDHAFVILDNQTVVMRVPSEETNFSDILASYRAMFEGYRIIEIETDPARFSNFRSSVNGVPFVHRETGERQMMFPVYEEDFVDPELFAKSARYFKRHPIQAEDLTSEGLAAYRAFQEAGYKPIPVRNLTSHHKGSLHCLTNVLAEAFVEDDGDEVV